MRRIRNPFLRYEGYDCFGCSPHNPLGLALEFYEEGDEVMATWQAGEHYQGYNRVLHGGIQATLLDEISSWVVFIKLRTAGVTQGMEVSYDRPSFVGKPVTLRGRLSHMEKNVAVIDARLFQEGDEPSARATCHYYTYPSRVARRKLMYPGIEAFFDEEDESPA
ncbi:MAG: PaaI family thioesterase [Spirochaetaceae bacterium]